MRRLPPALAALAFASALGLLAASASRGQTSADLGVSPPERYTGTYRYDGTPEDGARRVRAALQPAVARLNVLVRGIAEQRLRERARVAREIRIRVEGGRITIGYVGPEQSRSFTSREGETRQVRGQDGREARLTQRFREGHLEQVFTGENGRLYNLFELADQGARLQFSMVMTGERLERPIRIRLPYRRAP